MYERDVTRHWCCLQELPSTPWGYEYDCPGGLLHHTRQPPSAPWPLHDPAVRWMLLTTVATNLAFVPAFVRCVRRGLAFEAVLGLATAVTSALYHVGDTTNRRFWGMNPGQWHRLDNVFAIESLNSLVLTWMDLDAGPLRDALRWGSMVLTVAFQELGPWQLSCTPAPMAATALCFLCFLAAHPRHWRSYNRNMRRGVACMAVALFFFVLGLDEGKDFLRLSHGAWHCFIGAATYHFMGGCVTREEEQEPLAEQQRQQQQRQQQQRQQQEWQQQEQEQQQQQQQQQQWQRRQQQQSEPLAHLALLARTPTKKKKGN